MVITLTALDRKLLRDLWQMKTQVAAIVLVIASGIATFVMSLATLHSLAATQQSFYADYRFADVFASCKRAPAHLAERIASIPGVSRVQTRIVIDVNLDIPSMPEPAVGRLISIPETSQPDLNRLHLRRGRWVREGGGGGAGEALVSEQFADIHHIELGDRIQAIINGRLQQLRIVGVVLSPEYVLQMRGGEMLPDPKRFGIFWMSRRQLEAAYDMEGAFNDINLTLMHGASESEVLRRLDLITEPYGGIGSYGRIDQLSNKFVTEEIRQLRSMGITAPIIFLSVAVFLLNVVMARMIRTQREQIAALKAFGYTRGDIGRHYLKWVVLIVSLGVAIGVLVGAQMGSGLTRLYTQFYRFPSFQFHLPINVVLGAMTIAMLAAMLGAFVSVRHAVLLPPAEAMRPEPPPNYRATIFERLGFQRMLSQTARMILRKLEREPFKAALSCFGISLAVAVLVLGNFMNDALDEIIETQFGMAQRQDATVTFIDQSGAQAFYDVQHLPGVTDAEPFRSVPAKLRFGPRHERVGVMGLMPNAQLFRLIDADRRVVSPPDHGLLVSTKLAQMLDAKPGDELIIEVMEGERPTRSVPIVALIDDFAGANAYMRIESLRQLMREGNTANGAFLATDISRRAEFYHAIKNTPRIASVTITDVLVKSFNDTIAENQSRMQLFNIVFAMIIAFGVVYNIARISLTEREREMATLRVIGFTRTEVSVILLGELAILTLIALPLGMGIGYGFAAAASRGFETEMYRIPLVVDRATFAFAAGMTLIAACISGMVVRDRVDRLDLVGVLKSGE